MLRLLAIGAAAHFGDNAVIEEALRRFESGNYPVDLRGSIYRLVVKHGGEKEYEKMLSIYKDDSVMHSEKLQALSALGASEDKNLKIRTLEFVLSDDVRSQDIIYGPASTTGTLDGIEITWNFLTSNWEKICKKLEASGYLIARCVEYSSAGFISEEKANEVENFFKQNPTPQADRAIKQALESIRGKASWYNRDKDDVAGFFANN